MRFFAVIATLAAVLAVTPAFAQKTYTGFSCGIKTPCSLSDPAFPRADQLAKKVAECVDTYIGSDAVHAMDLISGLMPPEGCYAVDSSLIPVVGGTRTVPRCCLKPYGTNGCTIHCNIINE